MVSYCVVKKKINFFRNTHNIIHANYLLDLTQYFLFRSSMLSITRVFCQSNYLKPMTNRTKLLSYMEIFVHLPHMVRIGEIHLYSQIVTIPNNTFSFINSKQGQLEFRQPVSFGLRDRIILSSIPRSIPYTSCTIKYHCFDSVPSEIHRWKKILYCRCSFAAESKSYRGGFFPMEEDVDGCSIAGISESKAAAWDLLNEVMMAGIKRIFWM